MISATKRDYGGSGSRSNHEACSCQDRAPGGVDIQHGTKAEMKSGKFLMGGFQRIDRSGSRHGDFETIDPAKRERFRAGEQIVAGIRPHNPDHALRTNTGEDVGVVHVRRLCVAGDGKEINFVSPSEGESMDIDRFGQRPPTQCRSLENLARPERPQRRRSP